MFHIIELPIQLSEGISLGGGVLPTKTGPLMAKTRPGLMRAVVERSGNPFHPNASPSATQNTLMPPGSRVVGGLLPFELDIGSAPDHPRSPSVGICFVFGGLCIICIFFLVHSSKTSKVIFSNFKIKTLFDVQTPS